MRIRDIVGTLIKRFQNPSTAHTPTWLWGPPGIGKSSIVRQVADQLGMLLMDVRAVTLDSVDVRGIPFIVNGQTCWAVPDFLPLIDCQPTILFLDELAQSVVSVQSAFLQLTLDRRVGSYKLPDNVIVIAASNRQEDRAGANRVISPLLNRFKHIDFDVTLEDFQAWGLSKGISPMVMSYLNWKPDQLLAFDPKKNEKAFPSPRSWEFASAELSLNLETAILNESLAGIVGPGAATELCAFIDVWSKLPSAETLLNNAKSSEVFERPDMAIAAIGSVTDLLRRDNKRIDAFMDYVTRYAEEYAVLAIRQGNKVCTDVMRHQTTFKYIAANRDLFRS